MTQRQRQQKSLDPVQQGFWSQTQEKYRRCQPGTPSTQQPPPLKICPCQRSSYRYSFRKTAYVDAEEPLRLTDRKRGAAQGLYTEMKFEKPSRIQATTLPMILKPPYRSLIAQVLLCTLML